MGVHARDRTRIGTTEAVSDFREIVTLVSVARFPDENATAEWIQAICKVHRPD